MIFKIVTKSKQEIPIDEPGLIRFLEQVNSGKRIVLTEHGIIDVSSLDSVTPCKEKMGEVQEAMKYGKTLAEAEKEALGVSPFAKLLAEKMTMLSNESRTKAQEDGARDSRRE